MKMLRKSSLLQLIELTRYRTKINAQFMQLQRLLKQATYSEANHCFTVDICINMCICRFILGLTIDN